MTSDSRPPREWRLPLNTLIINSSFTRGGDDVHVIEKSAYLELSASMCRVLADNDQLAKELADAVALKDKAAEIAIALGVEHNRMAEELAEARAEIERLRPRLHWTERDWRSDCEIAEEQLQSQAALIEKCEHAIKSACRYDIKYGHNLEVVLAEIAKWKERGK